MNAPRVLIVEDESIVALDMQSRLTRFGYQVVGVANSGEEALELAQFHRPDLTLMDIRLRGSMDGIAVAEELRRHFEAPIIYLTAYADEMTLERAKLTEPYGYLVKPFEERELHSTVEMALFKIMNERRLKAHAARLQKIISTVPEGVALIDKEHRIMLANEKARDYLCAIAGLKVGEAITRLGDCPVETLLDSSNSDLWHEMRTSGSPPRIFEAHLSQVQVDRDVVTDVSNEQVLVIREVTMEREIRDRIQSQERLAAVGQFAAGIAHDFNNILTSIRLQPFIIQRREPNLSAKSLDSLESISQQAERAAELIKQILDFSRSSTVEMHPFDLMPLLKELLKMLERLLPSSVVLNLEYSPDDYRVNGDPTRTLQLLMNLASNARDAMPEGGELHIQIERCGGDEGNLTGVVDQRQWIRIQVSDTGVGIHPDVVPHIFEPFFTTKPAGKGTGLGLAQVYGIVQQHGGHIHVASQLGQGTTFTVYLPALLISATAADVHAASTDTSISEGKQQTILLVEDNPIVRQSICEILELANYRVMTALHGLQALAAIEDSDGAVDLIISDLAMPEMGGVELCRELKRRDFSIPVMILTGYASESTVSELRTLGIVNLLNKPADIDVLLSSIEQVWQANPI